MGERDNNTGAEPVFGQLTAGFSGHKLPLKKLAGRRQSRKTMACLEHALAEERLALVSGGDECSRMDAEARADLALLAVGLLYLDGSKGICRTGTIFNKVQHWQIEQARALINLAPDELCQEALWRVDTLPASLVETFFDRSLRGAPGEPSLLPVIVFDFWNAGLFACESITAARLLDCRSRTTDWQEKRCARDPRVMLAYLRTLQIRLKNREEVTAVRQLQRSLEMAIPLWTQGYQLGEDVFRSDDVLEGSMRTAVQVLIQHLYEIQKDPEFPWRTIMDEKSLGMVWQHDRQGQEPE